MKHECQIIAIPALQDNYIWGLINAKKEAIIIDPGDAKPVVDFLNQHQCQLKAILITHHHWDHTSGISTLFYSNLPVYGPANEVIPHKTVFLQESDVVQVSGFPPFFVMDIPGHTLGHIAYYSQGILFCGDTLFAAGCGRLFEGTAFQLYTSLQKLADLPGDTKIYCAHEYTMQNLRFAQAVEPGNSQILRRLHSVTRLREENVPSLPSLLQEEKETNPFLRCDSLELIAKVEKYANQRLENSVDVFTWLRKWKNAFVSP